MPITSLTCPCSPGEEQPLDHYDSGSCPLPPMQQGWYNAELHNQLDDKAHSAGNVTATRVLDCPRKPLIADFLPYSFNPMHAHKAHLGTIQHREAQKWLPPGCQAEVEVRGHLLGLEMSARIDCLKGNGINELKTHGGRWLKESKGYSNLVGDEYTAQGNIQRLLAEQSGISAESLVVSHTTSEYPDFPSEPLPLRDEEWIAGVRPHKGAFTVGQIALFLKMALSQPVTEEVIRAVPLVGKEIKFGAKSGCDYCTFRKVCDRVGSDL